MVWINSDEPLGDMKTLLDTNWVEYRDAPKPYLLIVNDVDEAISRINLNESDYLLIRQDGPEQEKYRGNISYHDLIFPIGISIITKENRQRMRNIYKEVRAICFIHKHSFSGWQFIRLLTGCTEMVNENLNIWRGEVRLQLENHAIRSDQTI